MTFLPPNVKVHLAYGYTDMRKGMDGLALLVQEVLQQDPFSGHLFVFRSRRGDRLKALYWDKDGYVLWYKRLEEGTFKMPKLAGEQASVELKASELAMLLDGIDLSSVKRVKRYRRAHASA